MKRSVLFTIALIFMYSFGYAQKLPVVIEGFTEVDHISYFEDIESNKINSRNQGVLQLEFISRVNDQSSMFGSVRFVFDESDSSKDPAYLNELYLDYFLEEFEFRLGKQIINWGKADTINPTDNITPWDYRDFLDNGHIGVFSLKINYYIGNLNIEGIVVPIFKGSHLPSKDSRWYLNLPNTSPNPYFPVNGNESFDLIYTFQESEISTELVDAAQLAGKISFDISGWDFSVSYYYGRDDLPTFNQIETVSDDFTSINVSIQPEYERLKVVGGDFSTSFGKFGIRGEAAFFDRENEYFQYVIGLDYRFSNLSLGDELFIIVQWIQELNNNDIEYRIDDINHLFNKSVSCRFDYKINESINLLVGGVYNIKSKGYYINPEVQYKLTDNLKLNLIGDILRGESNSFFGSFENNTRAQIKVRYTF